MCTYPANKQMNLMPAKRVFTYHPEIVPSDIKDNSVAAVAYQVCRSER
jgi:hypothetical protein